MRDLKELQIELTSLGLAAVPAQGLDLKRFSELHRRVGDIELYSLKNITNEALELLGYEERVTEGKYRSRYTPEMLVEPLIKFCRGSKFQPRNKKVFDRAVQSVRKKFDRATVRPIALEESYNRLLQDKGDHFAGLPTLGKKQDDLEALKRANQVWRGKCPPPAIIGHRGKNTEVVRAVWMFPFEEHIVEGAFYFPLYDVVSMKQSIYPVGALTNRRFTMRKYCGDQYYNTKFSIDYSGFDGSLNPQMIGCAFDILTGMLDLTEREQKVWQRVRTYFTTCPFLAPDGVVYKGRRGGVPSGSMFTQLVDSICNAIAIEYAMMMEHITRYRYLVYGDDSWTILHIENSPQEFLERVKTHVESLGLRMNLDKTAYAEPSEAIVFCGHYDIKRGRPVQDAVDKLCYPERASEAFKSKEGLLERVMAYGADSDLLGLMNAIYMSLIYSISIQVLEDRRVTTNLQDIMQGNASPHFNQRNLPGILQAVGLRAEDVSSLMKIRAAI